MALALINLIAARVANKVGKYSYKSPEHVGGVRYTARPDLGP